MKNIRMSNLKKCLFKTIDEFEKDIKIAFNEEIKVSCDYDGISFDNNGEYVDFTNICKTLAVYYDVFSITSIHIDDCEYKGVWICYIEQDDNNTTEIIKTVNEKINISAVVAYLEHEMEKVCAQHHNSCSNCQLCTTDCYDMHFCALSDVIDYLSEKRR